MNTLKPLYDFFAARGASSWTQGAHARNADGRACAARGKKATKFCVVGAMLHLRSENNVWAELQRRVGDAIGIGAWNDAAGRTYEDMLELLARGQLPRPSGRGLEEAQAKRNASIR